MILDLQKDPIASPDLQAFPIGRNGSSGFPLPCFHQRQVRLADLAATNLPIVEKTFLTVGGGIGSFVWADHLRIYGVPADEIMSIGMEKEPHGRFRRLCGNTQLPPAERLRGDSGSTPDNIWGWPGFAVREIIDDLRRGDLKHAAQIGWKIFTEPIWSDSYTPIASDTHAAVEKEARRIGWYAMARHGRVHAIRQTDDGRYVLAFTEKTASGESRPGFAIGQYVHLALGYPAARHLPDLARFRYYASDNARAVNSYEKHDHVYEALERGGGTLAVRGRGIVSSRIIQRIHEMRQKGADIEVLHLLRSPLDEGSEFNGNKRLVENHWELQPYNFPKAVWGGKLREVLADARPDERNGLIGLWGGTTTADRYQWRHIIVEGLQEGWLAAVFGSVSQFVEEDDGRISIIVRGQGRKIQTVHTVDYLVDAVGLDASVRKIPLYRDLIDTYELPRNVKQRLEVTDQFEIEALRQSHGRIYAAGAMTLGCHFAPVDSWLGLQYAAQQTIENMQANGALIPRMSPLRSVSQWFRWLKGEQP